mmetsp:Transcript_20637/g.54151  ORF Transcript_20637/g.54151 Transcript_20637/m.54151 type:complete len:253 (+) Transcript_20637:1005-1763(+)
MPMCIWSPTHILRTSCELRGSRLERPLTWRRRHSCQFWRPCSAISAIALPAHAHRCCSRVTSIALLTWTMGRSTWRPAAPCVPLRASSTPMRRQTRRTWERGDMECTMPQGSRGLRSPRKSRRRSGIASILCMRIVAASRRSSPAAQSTHGLPAAIRGRATIGPCCRCCACVCRRGRPCGPVEATERENHRHLWVYACSVLNLCRMRQGTRHEASRMSHAAPFVCPREHTRNLIRLCTLRVRGIPIQSDKHG